MYISSLPNAAEASLTIKSLKFVVDIGFENTVSYNYDIDNEITIIKHLKKEFGPNHHIHLYTSIPFNTKYAKELKEAGLDEIRFHLLKLELEKYIPTIEACAQAGILTGIELPAEPDKAEILEKLLDQLNQTSISFINLNELEITVGNYENMECINRR